MEGLILLAVLIALFVVAGAILSFAQSSTIRLLKLEISTLKKQVNIQAGQIGRLNRLLPDQHETPDTDKVQTSSAPISAAATRSAPLAPTKLGNSPAAPGPAVKPVATKKAAGSGFDIEKFIRGNGLFWLGGLVLAIGGIFLARYSIEAGLLSPGLRVSLGAGFGVVLIVAADYLSRHRARFHVYSSNLCAALASGGVITCFAMALVAYDYYHFISAEPGFVLLAAIALMATWLALRFGPVLAWIGVMGAYTVPMLVSSDSESVAVLYGYTALVSTSAIWIAQSVRQTGLWWLSFAAHVAWMTLGSLMADANDFAAVILFTLVTLYLYVLSDLLGWRLRTVMTEALPAKALIMPRKEQLGVLLPLLVFCGYLTGIDDAAYPILSALILCGLLCFIPSRYSALDSWPFLALALLLFIFTQMPVPAEYSDGLFPFTQNYLFAQTAAWAMLIYSALMVKVWQRPAYLLLLVIAPMSLYAISYALSPDAASMYLYPVWAAQLAIIAIGSAATAVRITSPLVKITLTVLSNACVTLCLTMLLDAATLTLALAIQIAAISYLSRKTDVEVPQWLYKVGLTVVTVRLTVAPWLDAYSGEDILGVRWTLVILPLVLGVFYLSRACHTDKTFRQWLDGGILHLSALFITTETSYFLVGHYPDFTDLAFSEAALLACNWLILSAVYLWRANRAQSFSRVYQCYAVILIAAAGLLHTELSFLSNPFLASTNTGEGLLLNWLLVLWLLPALVIIGLAAGRLVAARLRTGAFTVGGTLLFFYINGVIRGAFHPGHIVMNDNLPQAELYSYSIVWLLIAMVTIFGGQHRKQIPLRNTGFGILAVVLLKAFLLDTAHLEGLYRAISFIGLGLCLVGIGWLYQKLSNETLLAASDTGH